jgi:hypothetical protein
VELISVFPVVLVKMLLIYIGKIAEIKGTLGVGAFVKSEKLAVFFGNQRVTAVRADKVYRRGHGFAGNEGLSADFALVLSIATVIIVKIMMGSPTKWADGIRRNVGRSVSLDGFCWFAIFPEIVLKKELPVLFDEGYDDRQAVSSEFLVLWRV